MLNGLFEHTSHLPTKVLNNLDTMQNNQLNLQNASQQYLTTNASYSDQEEWNQLHGVLKAQTEQFTVIGQLLTVISQQNQQILQHLLHNQNNNNSNYNQKSDGTRMSPPINSDTQLQSQSYSPNNIDENINLPINNLNSGSIGISNLHIAKPVGSVGDNIHNITNNERASSQAQLISQILPDIHSSTSSIDPSIDPSLIDVNGINMNGLRMSGLPTLNGISDDASSKMSNNMAINGITKDIDQIMSSVNVTQGINGIENHQLQSSHIGDDHNPDTNNTISSSRSHSRSDSDEDPPQRFGRLKRININSFPYLSKFKKDVESFRAEGGRAPILRLIEREVFDSIMNYLAQHSVTTVISNWSSKLEYVEDDEFFKWALWSMELESQQNLSACLDGIAKHSRLRKQAPSNFLYFFTLVSELYDMLIHYSLTDSHNNDNGGSSSSSSSSCMYTPILFQSKVSIDIYVFENFHSVLKTYAHEKELIGEVYASLLNPSDDMKNTLSNMNGFGLNSVGMNGESYVPLLGDMDAKLPLFIKKISQNFRKEDIDEFLDRNMPYGHTNSISNDTDMNDYESQITHQRSNRININGKPTFASLAAGYGINDNSLNGRMNGINELLLESPKLGSGCFSCGNAYHPDRCVRRGRDGKTAAYCWYKEKQRKGLTEAQKKLGNKHFEAWRASKDAKV